MNSSDKSKASKVGVPNPGTVKVSDAGNAGAVTSNSSFLGASNSPVANAPNSAFSEEGHPQRWFILGFLCLSLVLIVASVSSVNVALPSIQRDLNATNSDLQWIVDSYALVFAGLLLPLGSLGDHYGRRKVLIAGLLIFGVATGIASAADAANQIIVMRAIMGVGAALIMPATLSIITEVFSNKEQPKAIAIWAGFAGAGGMIGPVGAGLALKWFWWGGVFLLTIPIVLVALFGSIFVVPPSHRREHHFPFDPLGALLSIVAIGTLVFAVIEGPNYGWTDPAVLGSFALGFLTTICFIIWERSTQHPMLNPVYFKNRSFTLNSLVMTVVFFGLFGWLFMLTQYFQFAQGHSALDAGLRMSPSAVVMLLVAPRSAALAAKIGTRKIVSRGLLLVSLGIAGLAIITPAMPYWSVLLCLLVGACGAALLMPTVTQRIVSSLPSDEAGVGSAVNDTTREVGGSIGIAIVGSLLSVGYRREIGSTIDELSVEASVSGSQEAVGALESAQDSIGRALIASMRIGGSIGERLQIAAVDAFDDGMTLGLGVAAGVVFLTCLIVVFFYPKEDVDLDDETGSEILPSEKLDLAATGLVAAPAEASRVNSVNSASVDSVPVASTQAVSDTDASPPTAPAPDGAPGL